MIDEFFALVIVAAGVYLLYAARELKQAHRVVKSVMLSPELHDKPCKDIDGLVKYMFPRVMALACVTILLGVYEIMINYAQLASVFSVLELVLYAVFFVVLFYYIHCSRRLGSMFY